MAVKLCNHCFNEINEGDKVCSSCGADLTIEKAIIEVGNEQIGYNYTSITSAYQDEELLNFSEDSIGGDGVENSLKTEDINDEIIEEKVFGNESYEVHKKVKDILRKTKYFCKHPILYSRYIVGIFACICMITGGMFGTYFFSTKGVVEESFLKRDAFFMFLLAIAGFVMIIEKMHKYTLSVVVFATMILIDLLVCFSEMSNFEGLGNGFIIWSIGVLLLAMSVIIAKIQSKYVEECKKLKHLHIGKRDFIWILLVVIISKELIPSMCRHNFKNSDNTIKNMNISTKFSEDIGGEVIIDIEGAYKKEYRGKYITIVELNVRNNTTRNINFEEEFDVLVYQSRDLSKENLKNSLSDIVGEDSDSNISMKEEKNIFFVYDLDSTSKDISLNIERKTNGGIDSSKIIMNTTMSLEDYPSDEND